MISALLLAATLSVTPADRLQMADRLFNRGKYAEARAEYDALAKGKDVAPDEMLFRLAECDRVQGHTAEAMNRYAALALRHPASKYAARSRFLCAMGATGAERRNQLRALDSDRVDPAIRAAALYHLGVDDKDVLALERCVKVDPKGKYAAFANLRRGSILSGSALSVERRKGIELLLEIGYSTDELANEALYLAALQCYRDKRYGEAGSLFRRFRKNFPKDSRAEEVYVMSVWCDFMEGRYLDAAVACGDAKVDDLAYIRAAAAYAVGDNAKALPLFRKYLEDFPQGKYRADAELPIARIEFDAAMKSGDASRTVEAAKRGYWLSKLAADELRLAWAYEKVGKNEDACREYGFVVKNFPNTDEAAEALYRHALIMARTENWHATERLLAESLALGKAVKYRASSLYWRGIAAMKIGHEKEGAGFLKDAMAQNLALDEAREARLVLADYDLREGRVDQAKSAYAVLLAEGAAVRMSAGRLHEIGKLLGGRSARISAQALVKLDSPEWRQAGWALLGSVEEAESHYTAAIEAYRKCLGEPVKTAEAASAALHLGVLESKAGAFDSADDSLKQAVALNAENPRLRAESYVALAKNAEARGDAKTACAYATVVTSLFEAADLVAEAKKILAAHPEVSAE